MIIHPLHLHLHFKSHFPATLSTPFLTVLEIRMLNSFDDCYKNFRIVPREEINLFSLFIIYNKK